MALIRSRRQYRLADAGQVGWPSLTSDKPLQPDRGIEGRVLSPREFVVDA